MVDYRLLKDEENRKLLKFGWFAGVAGTVDFLRGDLRTGVEISNTQKVLDGDLDTFIAASLKQGL